MKRIAVVGSAGSGKSTVARHVGAITGLEVVHLDSLYWRPGWVATPEEEWRQTVAVVAARDSWIIDGNYGRSMAIRLDRADTIVFMDFPRLTCVWRVFKRWLMYRGKTRPDLAPGCPERLDWEFVKWVWGYRHRSRPSVLERIERRSAGSEVFVLRTQVEVDRLLDGLRREASRAPDGNWLHVLGGQPMAGSFDGKVALVTGGNSGIGQATVIKFAQERRKSGHSRSPCC